MSLMNLLLYAAVVLYGADAYAPCFFTCCGC
jgi:hypothetical protein